MAEGAINLDEALKQDSLQASRQTRGLMENASIYSQEALKSVVTLGLAPQDDAQQYASLNAADRVPVVKIEKA